MEMAIVPKEPGAIKINRAFERICLLFLATFELSLGYLFISKDQIIKIGVELV